MHERTEFVCPRSHRSATLPDTRVDIVYSQRARFLAKSTGRTENPGQYRRCLIPRGDSKFLLHLIATDGAQYDDSDEGQDKEADEEDEEWKIGIIGGVLHRDR